MPAAMAFSQLLLDHTPFEVASERGFETDSVEDARDGDREPTRRASPKVTDSPADR